VSPTNLEVYDRPEVAAHYAELSYLTACEQSLFGEYIRPGTAILDLGVGGGRTTPYLSGKASRYVGIDYAPKMIEVCRQKYPGLEFRVAEASDLSCFEDGAFEVIVCAFNGMDYVMPDEARASCLKECHRVLKAAGILLFSSHNPRAILLRSGWNRERAAKLATRFGRRGSFFGKSTLVALTIAARLRAACRTAVASLSRAVRRIPTRAFWHGEGYLFDPAHGGLMTHCWIPDRVINELERYGFQCQKVLGNDYPAVNGEYSTDWYYYVFSKMNTPVNGEPCASL
jgi:ubiquinone/menaquinone biosynthesis C-methylase UbiE